ncbi:hypothetical protein [Psychrobacillus psychrodurans]|uniref:hypothetical protein n=1 Tax=Psychrobacillus psychrodurans TaxID=126157 RepID=UPI0008E8E161|nr:hypothetical protein [Psychrobacillus psychrodurans]MCZ8542247.1 hypothetical protein [Psychrobacillus psychrodurans]SFN30362.1 hypothetical protein SAMN05421832_1482 [Psychrobacillus psychrodurans]
MKKNKYLAIAIVLVLLSIYLYKSFIYYSIPFNPIKEYSTESDVDFYITKNLPDGEGVNAKCHDAKNCGLVLEYLSGLKLIPLKDKVAQKMLNYENATYFNGILKFNESEMIFISDISIDTPNVLRISSSITGFKDGYYEIEDSTFDYNYIYDLIGDTKE